MRALAAVMLLAVSSVGFPDSAGKLRFDIPSQSLDDALREFSRQAKQHLLYPSDVIGADLRRGLRGYYTVEEGLAQLLDQTDLEFVVDGHGSVAIRRRTRAVKAEQPTLVSATADAHDPVAEDIWRSVSIAEVIVTARRRQESLQQVPLAVTSIDADEIEARGIQSTEDLNARAPGVAVNGGNFFGRTSGAFRVRGVPGVAVYVDGVVRSGSAGLLMNVVEIERLEVLRGPQGTTFGKNAIGGAIQYVTRKPREEQGLRIKATTGSANRTDLLVDMDLPLSETLLSKFTAATLNRDGYVDSIDGDFSFGDQRDRVLRADLLWRPNEAFNALLIGEYAVQKSNGTPGVTWQLNPVCPGDQLPRNFVGPVPNSTCIYEAVGMPIDPAWLYGASEQWKSAANRPIRQNSLVSSGATLELNWDVNERLHAKSISGYREIDSYVGHDFDGTPYHLYQAFSAADRQELSEELQLLYNGERLTGTSGIYYYADRNWSRRQNWVANELRFDPYLSARQALGDQYAAYDPMIIDSLTEARSEGWAAFAEWTARLTGKLSVSVGARYTQDDITQNYYRPRQPLAEECCTPTRSLRPNGPKLEDNSGSATFDEVSPRISIQYRWSPDLMTYFTRASGFSAGGFSGGNVPFLPNGGFLPFGPETLISNEIGIRADLLDRRLRLNATLFDGEYDDVQITEELQEAPGFPVTTNAGEGRIRGLELEGAWNITKQLTLQYGASWLHTEFTEVGRAKNLELGSEFAYAPEFAYSIGAQYDWSLPAGSALSARFDYGWQDRVFTQSDINTRSRQRAYGVGNARLSYRDARNRWEVSLFGSNLFNEFYRINGFFLPADQIDTGTPGRPREWGLSVRYATN
ncbi:TonB-dependent receptor domain-containing protein [Steroidobacter agaridevorans]|uniref:TonB-dependent receptor domain-containing protein n=1 Tax=Steroidobacter agaridevorans TaxID=2695856 RepID=UPI001328E100|nr:TonB-dependent receptor [Steroidobacter agaridevorans]GFE85298.1 TonB-dependent receptor [Steroidobacter agaridevorans]